MKIAFVSAAQSSHTIKWVNALSERGHTIYLYSLPNHENKLKNISDKVKIIYLKESGFAGYFLNSNQLKNEIADFQPDIVNVHYASGYGTLVRRSGVRPVLLSVWGSDVYDFPYKSFLHKNLVKRNIEKADKVASTSYVMAEQVKRVFHYKKPIFITPFGVDCDLFSKQETSTAEEDVLHIGTVKALEDKYGISYLIKAFAALVKKLPRQKCKLSIYGKGSKQEELQNLIDSLGIGEIASLCGVIPNTAVPAVINTMDIFCLPSTLDSESFGVSAVEAMACEVPVIASDVDGFTETVDNGVTGYVVARNQVEPIVEKLYLLATDKDLRKKLGLAGRERVLRLYDFDKNVEEMEEFYIETIKASSENASKVNPQSSDLKSL